MQWSQIYGEQTFQGVKYHSQQNSVSQLHQVTLLGNKEIIFALVDILTAKYRICQEIAFVYYHKVPFQISICH